jgi:hypothetical protein
MVVILKWLGSIIKSIILLLINPKFFKYLKYMNKSIQGVVFAQAEITKPMR